MQLLDATLSTGGENLALDEALLLHAESGGPSMCLRFWEMQSMCVVVGSGGRIDDDVHRDACRRDGVPILRRSSGGGTVLLGPGCLLYTLVLPFSLDPALTSIRASYVFILERLASTIRGRHPDVQLAGISDLALGVRKFSGNAQQRKRGHLLHHGTILHAFPIALCERYLKLPDRRPQYRGERSHLDFLTNLPWKSEEIKAGLASTWSATGAAVLPCVQSLMAERYGDPAWHERR